MAITDYNPDEIETGDAVSVRGWKHIAFRVVEFCAGDIVKCRMIGDDAIHRMHRDDLTKLEEDAFCGECGQIACGHN